MDITAVVARHGDGWLTVDTAEWIEDKLGDQDGQLTEDLDEWLGGIARGCWDAAGWARHRFPHATGPSSDDDHPVVFNSANEAGLAGASRGASSRRLQPTPPVRPRSER